MNRYLMTSMLAALAVSVAGGCKDEPKPAPATQAAKPGEKPATPAGQPDEHPNAVSLGKKTAGGMTIAAMQDEEVKAGEETAFDLKITGYPEGKKPKAVRFWVGLESAEGSAKAKAGEEKDSPDTWHTHVDVPSPTPVGSQFWAEIEPAEGEKFTVSFDLKK